MTIDISFYADIRQDLIDENIKTGPLGLFTAPHWNRFSATVLQEQIQETFDTAFFWLFDGGPEPQRNRPMARRPLVMGISSGLHGAIAVLSAASLIGDMPLFVTESGESCTDVDALYCLIKQTDPDQVFIEHPPTPSANFAIITDILAAVGTPVTVVNAPQWRDSLKIDGDVRASRLLPKLADQWPLKEHGSRAEAALIAFYGSQTLSDPKKVQKMSDSAGLRGIYPNSFRWNSNEVGEPREVEAAKRTFLAPQITISGWVERDKIPPFAMQPPVVKLPPRLDAQIGFSGLLATGTKRKAERQKPADLADDLDDEIPV
jgi:hypothetical protein